MRIRPAAPDDALDILDWRNDPVSRAMSGDGAPIARAAHLDWCARTLADPERTIFIGEDDGGKLGMVRFDRSGDGWTVSIAVAPSRRGQGAGGALLRAGLGEMAGRAPAAFTARIKADNDSSLRLFAAAGFREVAREDGFVLTRLEP